MLRRALGEAMRRLTAASSDAGALVDRRIVVKLLVTFFERGRSPEVLALMARMLGMSGARLPSAALTCQASIGYAGRVRS